MTWSLVRRAATAVLRAQKLTLIGRGLRPISSVCTHIENENDNKIEYDFMGCQTAKFVEHIIKCQKNTGIVFKAVTLAFNDIKLQDCSMDAKLKVIYLVFNRIRNLPQADPYEVFLMKIFLRSIWIDDSMYELTREDVSSRVLDVIQSYPKVARHYKVTEETHFKNDLRFEDFDYELVHKALNFEFKLYIPKYEFYGLCKESIDYICAKQGRRKTFKRFRLVSARGKKFWTS